MPTNFTRSFVAVTVPGATLVAPWIYLLFCVFRLWPLYLKYTLIANALLVGVAVIAGLVLEGIVVAFERRWDDEREGELQIQENWYTYLAAQPSTTPVGFSYISRLVTTMYFELTMMVACPAFSDCQ
jgi:hypothetical protein